MTAPVQFVASSDPMYEAVFDDAIQMAGFFKSIKKALKKVVKKAAPIAAATVPFIPGVGPIAAAAVGAAGVLAAGSGGVAVDVGAGQPAAVPRGTSISPRNQLPLLQADVARNALPFGSTLVERSTVTASPPSFYSQIPWKTIGIVAGGLVVLVVLTQRGRR